LVPNLAFKGLLAHYAAQESPPAITKNKGAMLTINPAFPKTLRAPNRVIEKITLHAILCSVPQKMVLPKGYFENNPAFPKQPVAKRGRVKKIKSHDVVPLTWPAMGEGE